jgi:predicted RecB family nuclease
LLRYVRCPYAFWLLATGRISFDDTVTEFQQRLLTDGVEFQALVESSLAPIVIKQDERKQLLTEEIAVLGTPHFENRALRIRGQPDGIDMAGGALYPIEVKSHKNTERIDELELAFYWLLLAPYRTREVKPEGRLILRRDGNPFPLTVPIADHRIAEVRALLPQVRKARRYGVKPRVCRCRVCSSVRRDEVLTSVIRRKDNSMVFGVGREYSRVLDEFGLATWQSLLGANVDDLATQFSERGYKAVATAEVRRWQLHAQSYQLGGPVLSADATPLPVPGPYIALDLEYDSTVWLIGTCLVDGEARDYEALWANSAAEEKANLTRLAELVATHPELPVVTWAGDSADIPNLRKAALRHRCPQMFDDLGARHVDAYRWLYQNLRLPITGFTLKEVGKYYGVPRLSMVADGFQALLLYQEQRETNDQTIRSRLVDYNRDDLDALIEVTGQLRQLSAFGT